MLRPHLLLERKALLNVPDLGRSSHEILFSFSRLVITAASSAN